jgi:ParB family chromosome partitioning protein
MTSKSNIQLIPLNRLQVSDLNVRRRDRKVDIDALAASISAHGLLQNLSVTPREGDKFDVVAGGRRLAALKSLAKAGAIAKDYAVPCSVLEQSDAKEASLAENVHRVAMDAMDEVDAFAALVAEGLGADDVARRFGVTRKHVDQRLALSNLSPLIKSAWKRGDINLDCARAFCMVDDHAQQNAVYRSLSKPISNPASVRARLMEGRVRASDRLAVFVGLEAYEAAGGAVMRDLFDAEAVFLAEPALLAKLAEDKLKAARADWLAKGWGWVDLNLDSGRIEGLSSTRLYPEWRDPTSDETAELNRLEAALDELDAALEANGVEDDPRWSARDDLEAEYETIRQAARCWNPDLMKLSGVLLSVDHDGEISAAEGIVRTAEQKQVEAFLKAQRAPKAEADDEEQDQHEPAPPEPALPKSVARDLTLARTRAIREALAAHPEIALAVCVAAMARSGLRRSEMTGVGLAAHVRDMDDLSGLGEARADLEAHLPDDGLDTLDWALGLSRDRLLAALAILTASCLDLAHEHASPADLRLQTIGDRLAQHLDVDMTHFWRADLDYWLRLPKSALIDALMESPETPAGSAKANELLKLHTKMRKSELAAKVAALHDRTGYLPALLVTPLAAGAVELTEAGAAVLAIPAVAAE